MMKSRIIKILGLVIVVLLQFITITNKAYAVSIGETKDLERGELGYYCVQKWNGSKWIYLTYNQTFYTDTDGQRYTAYCLSPGLPGVGYVSGEEETYQVRVNELLSNDTIWRVLKNGYPNKSIEELGVETSDDAYFATMQAINAILRGYSLDQSKELYTPGKFAINGESLEDIQRRGNKTLNAMYNLIDIGLHGTENREEFLGISVEEISELKYEDNEFYSKMFKVQSQSEISTFGVVETQGLPEGTYIADLEGNQRQTFNGEELFKIMIPKDSITEDIKGKISVKAMQKNYPVYYGASVLEGYQDYALCNNSYAEAYASKEVYIRTDKSRLTIRKVDRATKEPIEGVKFQIAINDEIINTATTNKDGIIQIANLRPGKVTIKEIETVGKYKINTEEIVVELKYNEEKEVEVENELQKGNIKIIKMDKENNEIKLANVKFQLKDENDEVVKEGVTDERGELIFENLVVGNYRLVEVESSEDYIVLDKEISLEVQAESMKVVNIENEKVKKEEESNIKNEEVKKVDESVKVKKTLENKKLPKTGNENNMHNSIINIAVLGVCTMVTLIKRCL